VHGEHRKPVFIDAFAILTTRRRPHLNACFSSSVLRLEVSAPRRKLPSLMRLFDRYIGRQVLVGTLFAILLLSTILVMGSLFQKIRPLLVDFGAPPSIILEFLISVIPFYLIYTIPWAFLSAVLLVFGRMSSDHELTGFRVAGISLTRLAAPVFVLGAALSGLCLWLNVEVAPRSKQGADQIAIKAFFKDPRSMLSAAAEQDGLERLEDSLKGIRAYIEKSDNADGSDSTTMRGLHLFKIRDRDDPSGADIYVHAMRAEAVVDEQKREFRFHLYDSLFETSKPKTDKNGNPLPGNPPGEPQFVLSGEAVPLVLPFEYAQRKESPSSKTNRELREFIAANPKLHPKYRIGRYWAEMQRRYASSFACLAFAFIGIPLGIKARRKDTSTGLILSLLIGAAYFVCGMMGGATETGVLIATWAPNVVCVVLGLILLRRARFR
jgi:lipopolysaccharide export LptBFGC system permease protein LptF